MQQSQRARANAALEYALALANEHRLPLLAVFGLTDGYPEANLRHYRFLLEGLRETQAELRQRGVGLAVRYGAPPEVALGAAADAAVLVCDRGYLRHQKEWRQRVAAGAPCPVVQVEADVVVPVETASGKAEWAARTIRPKIVRLLEEFLNLPAAVEAQRDSLHLTGDGLDLGDLDRLLGGLNLDRGVPPVHHWLRGGAGEAQRHLHDFLTTKLGVYQDGRGEPARPTVSHLSPYLHFGQVSPVAVALAVRQAAAGGEGDKASFLEELIIRRELAVNFAHHTPNYDAFACLPNWAREALARHAGDPRPHTYDRSELEQARTHDRYWNAAMNEMRYTGYLHNHMRMYWGKKILEWSPTPEVAYRTALWLNNRYLLDGRDANSYANVGWLFGLHDRPWQRRPVFGTIRYLSAGGLERKCDVEGYCDRVDGLVAAAKRAGVRFAGD